MPPHQSTASSMVQPSRTSSIQSRRLDRRESAQHLRPEDAYTSPPRRGHLGGSLGRSGTVTKENFGVYNGRGEGAQYGNGGQYANGTQYKNGSAPGSQYGGPANHENSAPLLRSTRDKRRGRSSSRRRQGRNVGVPHVPAGQWKKLLWVKQSYPDNYTDEETFLDHLQRNPRLRPYEFWPLVADSTIIVQHVCSVIIFVSCFSGILVGRLAPQVVVGWATGCTVLGWIFKDYWQSQEGGEGEGEGGQEGDGVNGMGEDEKERGFAEGYASLASTRSHSRDPSASSISGVGQGLGQNGASSPLVPHAKGSGNGETIPTSSAFITPYGGSPSPFSPRMQERLTTAKSAILIYCSLLGLSPILKSLTLSTSSDSIWALSSWLMGINVFTFDYGAGPAAKFPASLSTNAALMASTVLASRLPTTTHVFSLTLFSIEVFGLFPVFRRHLRHHSWTGHLWLTVLLVVLASGGLSVTISGGKWGMAIVGVVLGSLVCCLSMGFTSWWLIGLQRYKNEIHGPWDPARPVIARRWD